MPKKFAHFLTKNVSILAIFLKIFFCSMRPSKLDSQTYPTLRYLFIRNKTFDVFVYEIAFNVSLATKTKPKVLFVFLLLLSYIQWYLPWYLLHNFSNFSSWHKTLLVIISARCFNRFSFQFFFVQIGLTRKNI